VVAVSPPAISRAAMHVAVGVGSALGGLARWLLSEALGSPPGVGIPWATLLVNASGSFLIGAYAAQVAPGGRWHGHGPRARLFVMTGFCGGYTTFSIFSLETMLLLQAAGYGVAGLHAISSLVLWLAAAWSGYALARRRAAMAS
jgi:fluoride exporter